MPAAAVIRRMRALSGFIGFKGCAGGLLSQRSKPGAQPLPPLKLAVSSWREVCGMRGVAVKCIDIAQNSDCEGSMPTHTDAEARKRGYRTGLDTLVVHAVNDECWLSGGLTPGWRSESDKHSTWGVRQATVKLKGIDEVPHKRRNMWFNSMIREEPYPGSNGE